MELIGREVVSGLREVTYLPLFKIFAYIDFRRGEYVLTPIMYEWGNGGKDTCILDELESNVFRFGKRLSEIWGKLQTLPPSKILDILWVGGRTVISGVPNGGRDRFRPSAWVFRHPRHMNASRRLLRLVSW